MAQMNTQQASAPQKHAEEILVIKREALFPNGAWHGIKEASFDEYLTLIEAHKEFHPRFLMETDPRYKQIIPYLVFEHDGRYFLMQRAHKASETRLQSKFTLGIGGHIRKEDITGTTIFDWARREFNEEVIYDGQLDITPIGILNDDTNEVGQVHVGFVFLLRGDSKAIRIKSELQSGELIERMACADYRERMEGWSQHVYDFLQKRER